MISSYKVLVDGTESQGVLAKFDVLKKTGQQGKPVIIHAQGKVHYQLVAVEQSREFAPPRVFAKRSGSDLHLIFEEEDARANPNAPDVVIKNYYDHPGLAVLGVTEEGATYAYVAESGMAKDYLANLSAELEPQVLGDGLATPWWLESAGGGDSLWALGGLALLGAGLAAAGGGGSSNGGGGKVDPASSPSTTVQANDIDGNKKPNATGLTDPNTKVVVTWPDGTTSTTTSDKDGNWSVESSTQQPSGTVQAHTETNGQVGVTASASYNDGTLPTPTASTQDANSDNKPEVSGTGTPNNTITVKWPDGTSSTVKVDASGNWTIEASNKQPDGEILVSEQDSSGHSSAEVKQPWDAVGPSTTLSSVSDPDNNNRINAEGQTEANAVVTVKWPDGTSETVQADASGHWEIESSTPQGNGKVTAQASNTSEGAGKEVDFTYKDEQAPSKPSISITDPDKDEKPTVGGTGTPGDQITIKWPDGTSTTTSVNGSGTWEVTSTDKQPSGSIEVTEKDPAGNSSPGSSGNWSTGGTGGGGSGGGGSGGGGSGGGGSGGGGSGGGGGGGGSVGPSVSLSVDDFDKNDKINATGVVVGQDGKPTAGLVTITWPDGTHSTVQAGSNGVWSLESPTEQTTGAVTAQASNANGVGTIATSQYTDVTPPAPPLSIKVTDPDSDGLPDVSGTAKPNETVVIKWPNGTSDTVKADANGDWSIEATKPQLDGDVSAVTKDQAGNESTPVKDAWKNKLPGKGPNVSLEAEDPDGDDKINASGIVSKGNVGVSGVVVVTWPDKTTSTVQTDAKGVWEIESPTKQPSGLVTAQATNAKGEIGNLAEVDYKDTTPPAPPTNITVTDPDGNNHPDVSGKADAGDTVVVKWPDGTSSTVQADGSGNWSIESPNKQPDGNVNISTKDPAGNSSTSSVNEKWDGAAPSTTLKVDDADNNDKINASGVATPDSIITVTWPDHSSSTVKVDASGNWSIESPTTQGNGDVIAIAKDGNGESAPVTEKYVDTQAPVPPTNVVVTDPDGDNQPDVSGEAKPDATVVVKWPDGTSSTVKADGSGNWSIESPNKQPDGDVVVTTKDPQGNESAPVTEKWDAIGPTTTLKVDDLDNNDKINASGVATPDAKITVTWPDGSSNTVKADASGNWKVESTDPQKDGVVTAIAEDSNGQSAPVTATYTDTQAPVPPTNVTVTDPDGDNHPDVSGQAKPDATVVVTWPDNTTSTVKADASGNWTVESLTKQPDGEVTVTTKDPQGNESTPVKAVWDGEAPTTTLKVDDLDNNDKINASGVATPDAKITVTWPDGSSNTVQADASGNWKVESTDPQKDGVVTAIAEDSNGKSTPVTATYTDTQAPVPPTNVTVTDPDNDNHPDASGEAKPGVTVVVKWPDNTTSTVKADASGNWSVESLTKQPDGEVTVTTKDPQGNESTPVKVVWDGDAPTTTLKVDDLDNNDKINASGVATPDAKITVTWPDGSSNTVQADASGNWKIESTDPQKDGVVTAIAEDSNGKSAPVTATYTDTQAPVPPTNVTVTDPDGDNHPDVSGQAKPDATVVVTWPDNTTSTVKADASGNWTVESPTKQPDGEVSVTTKDPQGNESTPVKAVWDGDAPTTTLKVDDLDNNDKINASGVATPDAKITVTWPDGSSNTVQADASGNWKVESTDPQKDGVVTAIAEDANGKGTPVTATYTDTQAPVPPTNVTVTDPDNDNHPDASGEAKPGVTVIVKWPDNTTSTVKADASGNWTIESPTKQPDGEVSVTTKDPQGNESTPVKVVWDGDAPTTTLKVDDLDNNDKINASGVATPDAKITVTWPDGTSNTVKADASGNWKVESTDPQKDGVVTAIAEDSNGKSAPVTATYTDTQAPVPPTNVVVTDPDGDNQPDVSGQAKPDATVVVKWPDGTSNTVKADGSGNWAIESPTKQPDGDVTVTTKDPQGNQSTPIVKPWDGKAPNTTLAVDDKDQDDRINANGVTEPNATVTVKWPDGTSSTVKADASGNWSVESATPQTDGQVTAQATDGNGTGNTAQASYQDRTPPQPPTNITVTDPDKDGQPDVNGSGTPGDTIIVIWPDKTTSTTKVDGSGNWNIESPTKQPDGTITVVERDPAGNNSMPGQGQWTAPKPPATTLKVEDTDNDDKIDASGVATPNATVTVTWPDATTSTVKADASGNWAIESPNTQKSGEVAAQASDSNGTSAVVKAPYSDTQAPPATTLKVTDPDDDNHPTATGVARPGDAVTIKWPDNTTSTVKADGSGNWSIEAPKAQPDGEVIATVKDPQGNISAPAKDMFDGSGPGISLAVHDNDRDDCINAQGYTDPNAKVTVTWPDGTTSTVMANASGWWEVESPTTQTTGQVIAQASNDANGVGDTAFIIYKDRTPPKPPTMNVSDPDGDAQPDVSGTAKPGETVTVTWPDKTTSTAKVDASGNWSVESPSTQVDGAITAIAKDQAGNSSTPVTGQWTAPKPPETTLAVADTDNDDKIDANGVTAPNATVTVTWPDATSSTVKADASGNWSIESPTIQKNGDVKAQAEDVHGKGGVQTKPYTDTQAPLPPTNIKVTDPDGDNQPDVSGKAKPDETVVVTWPDNTTSTVKADASGNWTIESPTKQPNGDVSVTIKDPQGNTSPPVTQPWNGKGPNTTLSVDDKDQDDQINASGVTEPNATVTVKWPDGTSSTAKADASGNWNVESATTQTDGQVTAQASNSSGNGDTAQAAYQDRTPPKPPANIVVTDPDKDGQPDVSGSGAPGDTIIVFWPDKSTSTTKVDGSGNWSVESPNKQPDGVITVVEKDPAGNNSLPGQGQWTATKPPTTTLKVEDTDNDDKIDASGVTTPNATVTVKWPDATSSTVKADANGNWAIESPNTQKSGEVTAQATDPNGTSPVVKATYNDTQAPQTPTNVVVTDPDGDNHPDVSGKAKPDETVVVKWPDNTTSTVKADASGNWNIESPTKQPNGDINVTTKDPQGNESPPVAKPWNGTGPATTLKVEDLDNDDKIDASGVTTPNATVVVTWPDSTTSTVKADASGNWSIESSKTYANGDVTAQATDPNGTGAATKAPYVDTKPPLPPTNVVVTDPDGDNHPDVSGKAKPDETVVVKWPDNTTSTVKADASGNWNIESPTKQPNGDINVTTKDPQGNESPPVAKPWNGTGPATTLKVEDLDNDDKIDASGVTTPNATVVVTWPDSTTSTVKADASGNWSIESSKTYANGDVTAQATDPNGTGAATKAPYVDTKPPLPPTNVVVTDPDGDNHPDVSGQAKPDETVVVKWPDNTTSTVKADASGNWNIESPTKQPNGDINVTTKDPQGNESTPVPKPWTGTGPATTLKAVDTDNDDRIDASGVTVPNANVVVTWPDSTTSTVKADASGNWSIESPNVQKSGDVTAQATDPNGVGAATKVPYSDTQAPPSTTLNVGDPDWDNHPDVNGVATPGNTVTVTWSDGTSSTVKADSVTGNWSLESPARQPDGNITATVKDPQGNVSAPVTKLFDGHGPGTGLGIDDRDANDRINAQGTATEPNVKITVTWPDGTSSTTTADASGAWAIESPTTQDSGMVYAQATSVNGPGALIYINYVDRTPPKPPTNVTVTDPDQDGRPDVSGQAKPDETVVVKWPDNTSSTVKPDSNGNWTIEAPNPQPGGSITVNTKDPAGNTSPPVTNPWVAPKQPPETTLAVSDLDQDNKIDASGVTVPNATVKVTWPDNTSVTVQANASGNWSVESTKTYTGGNVTAQASNADGTGGAKTALYTDVTAPKAVADEASMTEKTSSVAGDVSSNDLQKDGSETYSLVGSATGKYGQLTMNANGSYSYVRTANMDAIKSTQDEVFTYKVTDAAGNSSTSTMTVHITPVNDAPVLTGTVMTSNTNLFANVASNLQYTDWANGAGSMQTLDGNRITVTDQNAKALEGFNDYKGVWTANSGVAYRLGAGKEGENSETFSLNFEKPVYGVQVSFGAADIGERLAFRVNGVMITIDPSKLDSSHISPGSAMSVTNDGMQLYLLSGTGASGYQTYTYTSTTPINSFDVGYTSNASNSGMILNFKVANPDVNTLPSTGVTLASLMPNSSDIDGYVNGFAITNAASKGNDHWQYKDASGNWVNLDNSSVGSATFLLPSTQVRWTGLPGTGTALSAVAVDDSAVYASQGRSLDVSVRGGSTPYSQEIAVLGSGARSAKTNSSADTGSVDVDKYMPSSAPTTSSTNTTTTTSTTTSTTTNADATLTTALATTLLTNKLLTAPESLHHDKQEQPDSWPTITPPAPPEVTVHVVEPLHPAPAPTPSAPTTDAITADGHFVGVAPETDPPVADQPNAGTQPEIHHPAVSDPMIGDHPKVDAKEEPTVNHKTVITFDGTSELLGHDEMQLDLEFAQDQTVSLKLEDVLHISSTHSVDNVMFVISGKDGIKEFNLDLQNETWKTPEAGSTITDAQGNSYVVQASQAGNADANEIRTSDGHVYDVYSFEQAGKTVNLLVDTQLHTHII